MTSLEEAISGFDTPSRQRSGAVIDQEEKDALSEENDYLHEAPSAESETNSLFGQSSHASSTQNYDAIIEEDGIADSEASQSNEDDMSETSRKPTSPVRKNYSDPAMTTIPHDQIIPWGKTLSSPSLPSFTPSIESNKQQQTFHGTGLMLCITRGRGLNKTTKRCVGVLNEVASLYDQFATSIMKAGQTLPHPDKTLKVTTKAAGLREMLPLLSLQQSMHDWSIDKKTVSRRIRSAVSSDLQSYLATHNDSLVAIHQKYSQSRSNACYVRGRALSSYSKYIRATNEAESLIAELKILQEAGSMNQATMDKEKGSTNTSAPNTPVRLPQKRIEARLKEAVRKVRQYESRYTHRVKFENDCVDTCQRMEAMALESVQKIEEDRLFIFVNTVIKIVAAQKHALDAGVIDLAKEFTGKAAASKSKSGASEKHRAAKKLVKLLQESKNSFLSDEESTGKMDAETLGLSEELGELRDGVRMRIARRRERFQLARTLSLFFESIIKASAKLGQSLRQLMAKEGSNNSETLHVTMAQTEGAHVLRLWDGLSHFLDSEADGCFAMADSLRNVRAAKLDTIILHGEKTIKATSEADDTAWKQLCEAARAQARAEAKYRGASIESAKARDRLTSLDKGQQVLAIDESAEKNTKEKILGGTGKRMQKGLASIASFLPNGGDHASKILGPGAREAVAQRVLKDANEKESKEKQQLVAAVETTSAAMTLYKSDAENTISRYDEEERKGWLDIESAIESFGDLAQKLLGTLQIDSLSDLEHIMSGSNTGMATDINEWRIKAQQELVAICVDCNVSEDSAESGFKLDLHLRPSTEIDAYLETAEGKVVEGEKSDNGEEDLSDDENNGDQVDDNEGLEIPGLAGISDKKNEPIDEIISASVFKRGVFPTGSQFTAKRSVQRGKDGRNPRHEDPETNLFFTYFCPDATVEKEIRQVVDSFSCSFRDGAQSLPLQYGRVYLFSSHITFASWSKKRLSLSWDEVKEVSLRNSFDGESKNSIQIVCRKADASKDSCTLLDGFFERQEVFDAIHPLLKDAQEAAKAQEVAKARTEQPSSGGDVPPDPILKQMHIAVSKTLKNISIHEFHRVVWSDKEKPLYKNWVEREAFDVEMGDWREVKTSGPWCQEMYDTERRMKFRVKRKTHLYIGPPIATVIQVHRCRVVGNDKCIVSITVEFDGIPFSDTFAVEVRWVATRQGENDVKVECGIFVDFKKKTYLKIKIQSGTIEEATPVHKSWFQVIQSECRAAGGIEAEEDEVDEESQAEKESRPSLWNYVQENQNLIHVAAIATPIMLFLIWRLFFRSSTLSRPQDLSVKLLLERVSVLETKIDSMQGNIDNLVKILQEQSSKTSTTIS